jgi:hypothetical protein
VTSSVLSRAPGDAILVDAPGRARGASGRVLVLYGRLLSPLLAGYLLLDKSWAYIHLPGTPAYVGELTLTVGAVGVLTATGYFRIPLRDEPVLALLAAFFLWGLFRLPPGLRSYGVVNAIRDFALCYYCFFAFFTVAALARAPDLLDRWLAQLNRFVPWLLLWLPVALILPFHLHHIPSLPFTGAIEVLNHKPGNCAIAALLALGFLWLFPETRSPQSRALWSILALVIMILSATQNRGGLLGATAGAVVGLAFFPARQRLRLIVRTVVVVAIGLFIAVQLNLSIPSASNQGRAFTASQFISNVLSIKGAVGGSATATAGARDLLWGLIYKQQVSDNRLIDGYGFGVNLPYLVNDTQVTGGADPLRSPHNSHDDILARLGLIGLSLWIALWLGWYSQMVTGCLRLARRGMHTRRRVGVLCTMVVTAILVSSFFDPQLEGAQIAALMWTAFGIGVAVTSTRGWFGRRASGPAAVSPTLIGPANSYEGWQLPPTVNVPAVSSQVISHEEKSSQPFIHPNQSNV